MRRHQIQSLSLILMWIGGLETVASFLVKVWFSYTIQITPIFFLALLIGIALFLISRVI